MENIVGNIIAQWGTFGILIAFAVWIIYNHIKEGNKGSKGDFGSKSDNILFTTLVTSLSNKIDNLDNRIDSLENNVNNRLNMVELKLNNQPKHIIDHFDKVQNQKLIEHNKMMEDQMRLGPELHEILAKYRSKINCDHIFLGSFHNGNTNISGIPYCKFDIIAEKFNPDTVERDTEFAFMYKDADILRHDKLPITVLQNGQVHYIIEPDGTSELSIIDDIIYRRMVGRDIKQLAVNITRDSKGKPSGFVGCVKYDYIDIHMDELANCAEELEAIYNKSQN